MRPPILNNNDHLRFRLTPVDQYRIPFTFVEALNQGNLFDRSAQIFEQAAATRRLFEIVLDRDERIIGTGMFQTGFQTADGQQQQELGGLMVHPGARGIGILSLLLKLMLVHRYYLSAQPPATLANEEIIAHVVDGNTAPIHSLLQAGFELLGPVKLHPNEIDGSLAHMIPAGSDYVPMHAYRFDQHAINRLMEELRQFRRKGGILARSDWNLSLQVDFSNLVSDQTLHNAPACPSP